MRYVPLTLTVAILFGISACRQSDPNPKPANAVRIAFGSCAHHAEPQPILWDVIAHEPDVFIYLGDNIYGDTHDMKELHQKYQTLGNKHEFQALRLATTTLAIWDDHDYGQDDAGKEYSQKQNSKDIFLDFWQVPLNSDRYQRDGIHTSYTFGEEGQRIQVLLLDTRWFRDPLSVCTPQDRHCFNDYKPHPSANVTILGHKQWAWLREQLRQPAEIRIIASSIQFAHSYNGYESWTNFPHERQKMVQMIRETRANGVLFISGDVHWGEISKLSTPNSYPLYDVTSSGLTQAWHFILDNDNRIDLPEALNHFGMIEVDWHKPDPIIHLSITNIDQVVSVSHTLSLSQLQHPPRKATKI